MKILVTGGCGYKGSILVPRLLEKGYEVVVFDAMWFGNQLPEHPSLQIVQGDTCESGEIPLSDVETVIHLANVANDPSVELNPELSWEVNVLATQQLADRCMRNGVQQFIFASSGSVYGLKEEEHVTEELELVPISVYNKTKMVTERVLLSYSDEFQVHCIRPATVCGYSPRMRLDVCVNLLTMQALKNGKITVFGGDQTRPNIHIQDMARVYEHFLEHPDLPSGCYNAGFENNSIKGIAEMVREQVPAEITMSESDDPRSYRQNSDKLLATGFLPQFNVAQAIQDLVAKYEQGVLEDKDDCYNVKWMKRSGLV